MKNLFLVINKEKIYAYVVSVMTIVTVFFMSSLINSDLKETELTSANSIDNNTIGEAISTSTPFDEDTNAVNNEDIVLKCDSKILIYMLVEIIETILESEKDSEAKQLFNEYVKKGNTVVGNIQKRSVQFLNINLVLDTIAHSKTHSYRSLKRSAKTCHVIIGNTNTTIEFR